MIEILSAAQLRLEGDLVEAFEAEVAEERLLMDADELADFLKNPRDMLKLIFASMSEPVSEEVFNALSEAHMVGYAS